MRTKPNAVIAKIKGRTQTVSFAQSNTKKGKKEIVRIGKKLPKKDYSNISRKDTKYPPIPGETALKQYYYERVVCGIGDDSTRRKLYRLFNRQAMSILDTFWNSLTDAERIVWKREGNKQRRAPWSGLDYFRHINMRRAFLNLAPLRKPPDRNNSKIGIICREAGYPNMPPGKRWKMCLEGQTLPASPPDEITFMSFSETIATCFPPPYSPPVNLRCDPLDWSVEAVSEHAIKVTGKYRQPGPDAVAVYLDENYYGELPLPSGSITISNLTPATNYSISIASFLHEQGCGDPATKQECTWGELTLAADPGEGGTVFGDIGGHEPDDLVGVSASPATDWEFTGWTTTAGSIDDPAAQSAHVTMPYCENVTATAHFEELAPPAQNTCHDCDPPIPDTLYVTFTGLGGDLSAYNGTHELTWDHDCIWIKYFPDSSFINLYWATFWIADNWYVCLLINPGFTECQKDWGIDRLQVPGNPCDPRGSYAEMDCSHPFAGDDLNQTCEKSIGATCTVSYMP